MVGGFPVRHDRLTRPARPDCVGLRPTQRTRRPVGPSRTSRHPRVADYSHGPQWTLRRRPPPVLYHQKGCDKLEKHAHVVWQLDDQLRQDTIQPPRWEPYRSDTCDALVFAAGTMERLPNITWPSGPPP